MTSSTWRRARFAGITAAALFAWAMAASCLHAQGTTGSTDGAKPATPEFPVKMSVSASTPGADGKRQVSVTLTIDKGKYGAYHLHANPTGNADLKGAETVMKITGKGLLEAKIEYPAGDLVQDKIIGPYRIYQRKVTIKADVRRAVGDREPLLITVRVRPFDQIGCRWNVRVLKETVR